MILCGTLEPQRVRVGTLETVSNRRPSSSPLPSRNRELTVGVGGEGGGTGPWAVGGYARGTGKRVKGWVEAGQNNKNNRIIAETSA